MEEFTINDLKGSKRFRNNICWSLTPKAFLEPGSTDRFRTEQYMLYVDTMLDKPRVAIMRLRGNLSKAIGYIVDVPDELIKGAIHDQEECRVGMCPLTPELKEWLKKRFGLI